MRSIKEFKKVSIYLIDEVYRIVPYTLSDQGVPKAELSIIFLDQNVNLHELGEKVLYALHKPKQTIHHPNHEEGKIRLEEWLKAMKVKSWKSFIAGAKEIDVEMKNDKIKIRVLKPISSNGLYEELEDKARFCLPDDPKFLGQSIIDAFADCE